MNENQIKELFRFQEESIQVYAHVNAMELYFSRELPNLHKSDIIELLHNIDDYVENFKAECKEMGIDVDEHEIDFLNVYMSGMSETYEIIDRMS